MIRTLPFTFCSCIILASCVLMRDDASIRRPRLVSQRSGTETLLIGLHPVNERIVWASGAGGTFARTLDGGTTWQTGVVPGADSLQFRDVHAFGADVAYLLSIGPGPASRIYKTTDGGRTWDRQFVNQEPEAFFDCFDFWNESAGIAFSDGVDGRFPLARTLDGARWTVVPADQRPSALPDEGGFAASGTCLRTIGDSTVVIGTGNGERARFLRSNDRGRTWQAHETPIDGGSGIGITTLSFRDERHGVALGGDLSRPELRIDNVAVTTDGGRTWSLTGRPSFSGAVYGSAYVPETHTLFAVGPRGLSYSLDEGARWQPLDSLSHWSVGFASRNAGWAVGPDGRITKIEF